MAQENNMIFNFFLNLILIIFLAVVQFSFIPVMPAYFSNLNLVLVSLIFVLSLFGLNRGLWWAAGAGLILDSVSFYPFGIFLLSYFSSVILIYFLLKNFFTNRSVYSFVALAFFGSLFYSFVFNLYNYFFGFKNDSALSLISLDFWLNLIMQIIFNIAFIFIGFYLINFTTKKFNPVFLGKKYIYKIKN